MNAILIHMSVPPSLNKLWITTGRGRVRAPAYNKWLEAVGWEIRRQIVGMAPIACRYNLDIQVPISRRDTPNWEKGIGDALEKFGVVTNDGNVARITIEPVAGRTDCLVAITLLPDMDGVRSAAKTRLRSYSKPRAPRPTQGRLAALRRAGVLV